MAVKPVMYVFAASCLQRRPGKCDGRSSGGTFLCCFHVYVTPTVEDIISYINCINQYQIIAQHQLFKFKTWTRHSFLEHTFHHHHLLLSLPPIRASPIIPNTFHLHKPHPIPLKTGRLRSI